MVIPDLDDDQKRGILSPAERQVAGGAQAPAALDQLGRRGQQGVIAAPTDGPQPASGPAPVVPKITPQLGQRRASDEAALQSATQRGSGISQLPTAARIPLRVLEGIGGAILPKVTSRIPGTEMHHEAELGQMRGNLGEDVAEEQREAQSANLNAEAAAKPAQASKDTAEANEANARADALKHPQPKEGLTPEETTIHDLMTGENGGPRTNPDTGKPYSYLEAYQAINDAKQKPQKPERPDTPEQQFIDEYQRIHKGATVAQAVAAYSATTQKPERDQRQLGVINGHVVELKPGMEIPEGTQSLTGNLAGSKPTAAETNRADFTENLNENLDQLEDIVTRRPELFGKVAGRVTGIREVLGSNDPDIAALEGIKDRLGKVLQSSHGMRSAQHVAESAQSILNGFKNGPNAMKRAIADTRRSAATFSHDVTSKHPGSPGPAQQGAPPAGNDPLGIR